MSTHTRSFLTLLFPHKSVEVMMMIALEGPRKVSCTINPILHIVGFTVPAIIENLEKQPQSERLA